LFTIHHKALSDATGSAYLKLATIEPRYVVAARGLLVWSLPSTRPKDPRFGPGEQRIARPIPADRQQQALF
jgi:hypothetical protein